MTVPSTAIAHDVFHRTSSSGWGDADAGGTWVLLGTGGMNLTTDWSVVSPVAHHSIPATVAFRYSYLPVSIADFDLSATGSVAFTSGITGGNLELLGLMFRSTSTNTYYLARVEIAPGGSLTLKLIAPDATTILASVSGAVGGLTYTSGKSLSMRVRANGTWLKVKLWASSSAEPSTWDIAIQDDTTLVPGFVGIRSGVGSGNTNTKPVVFSYTEFWAAPLIVMTAASGRPFMPGILGADAAIATEIAPGADLAADPDDWPWVDITADVRHADGTSTTIGRADNVGSAPAAQHSCGLNNADGDYSPEDPLGAYYGTLVRNTPVRQLLTLDGSTWFTRFQGYLSSLVPDEDMSGNMATVPLTALGMLGRIAGKKRPLRSPLTRSTSVSPVTMAFWPMEDGSAATSFAPAIPGTQPGTFSGDLRLAGDTSLAGATALPVFGTASGIKLPGAATPSGEWTLNWYMNVPDPGPASATTILQVTTTSGTVTTWQLILNGSANTLKINGLAADGSSLYTGTFTSSDSFYSESAHWRFTVQAVSGTITFEVIQENQIITDTLSGTSVGNVTSWGVPAGQAGMSGIMWGMASILDGYEAGTLFEAAADGWSGETVTDRLNRLAAENGVLLHLTGTSDTTMGPQTSTTLIALLQECESADHGMLYDGLGPGVGYITRDALYDAEAAYTLDMSAQEITDPAAGYFDNQGVTNIVTAQRQNGSSATIERVDGATGTGSIGDDDTSTTINVETDDVLPWHAGFLAGLGDITGYRVPQIAPNMSRIVATIPAILAAGPRHRLDVSNPPRRKMGPNTLRLLAEGWTEKTSSVTWALTHNTSPYAPFDVLILDTDDARVAAGDGSTLHAGINTTAASFTADIVGPLWTTDAGDFPLDVNLGGEQITLSSISGTSSPQTFHVATGGRSINGIVKSHIAGAVIEVWQPEVLAL